MTLIHSQQFTDEEITYETRVFSSGWEITIRVFKGSEPANGYVYAVTLPTAFDLERIHKVDAVKQLIEKAENDVKSKLWDQYVVAYLEGLPTSERDRIGCLQCTGRNIESSTVDGRKMYECLDCNNIWYEQRKGSGGFSCITDSITGGVSENGSHEIDTEILLNGPFSTIMSHSKLSFEDQLRNWAIQNKLKYELFYKMVDDQRSHYTRFWR